jgi:hypothetical protein
MLFVPDLHFLDAVLVDLGELDREEAVLDRRLGAFVVYLLR